MVLLWAVIGILLLLLAIWITVLVTTSGLRRGMREIMKKLGIEPPSSAKKDRGVLLKILVIITIVAVVVVVVLFFTLR